MSDVRYGLRALVREPAFTLAAAVILALGIGATTAIFTLVRALLFEPLPYPGGERLVWIWNIAPRSGFGLRGLYGADFLEIRGQNRSFERMGGFMIGSWNVTGLAEPERLAGAAVTEDFFETLGMRPFTGRPFLPEEYRTGREKVVIFSYAFWRRRFGGDRNILGRRVTLDGIPFEVVGIMPRQFALATEYDLWIPLPRDSAFVTARRLHSVQTFGRLKNDVRLEQARTEAQAIGADLERRYPEDQGYELKLVTFLDQEAGPVRRMLWIFAAAVACVLLISCSNVASLLLARGAGRVREMAVRAAAGASRARLTRQLLVESGLLALAGGALGLPLAVAGVRLLVVLDPNALPRAGEIRTDLRALAFTFLLSLATGLVFGIMPALRGSRVSLSEALKEGGRSGPGGRKGNRLRAALVVIQVALGVLLMASAGLLARSLRQLNQVRPGYDTRHVLTMQLALTGVRYRDPAECVRFFERLIGQIERLPGVDAVGSTNYLPLDGAKHMAGLWLDSQPVHDEQTKIVLDNRVVTPGYFRAMGVPLVAGRFFSWTDRAETPKVVIVNEVFAGRFFPRGDALGRRITLTTVGPGNAQSAYEIVGVVGSFRESSLAEEPDREIFTVYTQTTILGQTLVVRTAGEPAPLSAAVRDAIAANDRDVPMYDVRTMQEQMDRSLAQPRFRGALIGVFSLVALALASFGVYGVIACAAAERKREIGIRVALGARPELVRRMIVLQGLKLTAFGLVLGVAGAAGAARLLEGFLFGVGASDPPTYVTTAAVFLAVTAAAAYVPARRATRMDPLAALREE
jgi:putative ABC transport system permease protein